MDRSMRDRQNISSGFGEQLTFIMALPLVITYHIRTPHTLFHDNR